MKKILIMLCAVSLPMLVYAPIYRSCEEIIYCHISNDSVLKKEALAGNEKLKPLTEVLVSKIVCPSEKNFKQLSNEFKTDGLNFKQMETLFLYIESCYLDRKHYSEASHTLKDALPNGWLVAHVCHKILEELGCDIKKRAKEVALFYHGFLEILENLEKTRKELEEFDKDLEQPVKSWDSEDLTKEEK